MTDRRNTAEGQRPKQERPELQSQYGCIGIEAVAAAVRFSNPGKKPAEQTEAPRIDQRFFEQAS
jgi:hypothetical protein